MIEINSLTYQYPHSSRPALNNINIQIQTSGIFGLVGPNGAGKTTFLKILSGLILPKYGTVFIDEINAFQNFKKTRKLLGISMGEERSFYYRLTGFQNLEFFGGLHQIHHSCLKKKIIEIAEQLGIMNIIHKLYMNYSVGEKKKLSLARCFLCDPQVLLLDEPTNGIDTLSMRKIRTSIKTLASSGKTIVITSHNLDEIEKLCDRVAVLRNGEVVISDTIEAIKTRFGTNGMEMIVRLRQDTNVESIVEKIEKTSNFKSYLVNFPNIHFNFWGHIVPNVVIEMIISMEMNIISIQPTESSFEDIYVSIAQDEEKLICV